MLAASFLLPSRSCEGELRKFAATHAPPFVIFTFALTLARFHLGLAEVGLPGGDQDSEPAVALDLRYAGPPTDTGAASYVAAGLEIRALTFGRGPAASFAEPPSGLDSTYMFSWVPGAIGDVDLRADLRADLRHAQGLMF